MLIAQISDCHIMAPGERFGGRLDSAVGLQAAIDAIEALSPRPDLVLATGDLVNDGTPEQYEHLCSLVDRLDIPLVPLMGNHDERGEFRRRFADRLPGDARDGPVDGPVDFAVDDHAVRIIALDTTITGRHDGELTAAQLAWLDARLTEQCDRPTIVAQHHPPFRSGVRWMDRGSGFASIDGERAVLERHDHVEAVVAGHLHRSIGRRFAGTVAMTCPSTAAALDLDLVSDEVGYSTEPTGFVLHHWNGEALTSHGVTIGEHVRWTPDWAE